jgi:Fe-S-cluster containining protein
VTDDPLSTLCRRCGLCCDGNLFSHVGLAGNELEPLRRRGLPIVARDDGSPVIRQRCPALHDRTCTIYDERPASCRRYRCLLYAALADHELSLAEALAEVDAALARIADVDAELPGDGAPLQRARTAARAGALSPAAAAALARAEALLARRFGVR